MILLNEVGCIGGGVGIKWLKILILSYQRRCQVDRGVQVWERVLGLKKRCGYFQHRVRRESWQGPQPRGKQQNHRQYDHSSSLWLKGSMSSRLSHGLIPRSRPGWLHVPSHALIICSLSAPDTRGPPVPFTWRSWECFCTQCSVLAAKEKEGQPTFMDLASVGLLLSVPPWIHMFHWYYLQKAPRLLQVPLLLP